LNKNDSNIVVSIARCFVTTRYEVYAFPLRKLHSEMADPARASVNENALPAFEPTEIEQ
jgi:hypothetical protein